MKQFKLLLLPATLMLLILNVFSQVKQRHPKAEKQKYHSPLTPQLKDFYGLAAEANVTFNFPSGFKEMEATDDEDFSFDYAMELPGKGFEIWLQVKSQKQNYISYQHYQNTPGSQLSNPDSLYRQMGSSEASTFAGDNKPVVRNIPPKILQSYNADAGKSYLLSLQDFDQTKHYKYALLITLQKNHTGTIMAVCFTNDKGPEFFKNIDRASHCLKFKNTPPQ